MQGVTLMGKGTQTLPMKLRLCVRVLGEGCQGRPPHVGIIIPLGHHVSTATVSSET